VTSTGQTANLYPQSGDKRFQGTLCGAIQAVLAHPTNPDICFAGSVSGGVWRTRNCRADFPDWKPLTDDQPSNSITDMKFDDTDPNRMLVGIGLRSSFGVGGPMIGLLLSNNVLADEPTWTVLNNAAGTVNFGTSSVEFMEVFMRGSLMMAASFRSATDSCEERGIWRSTDGSVTWTNVFPGRMWALAADPNTPTRFYAAGDFLGTCGAPVACGLYRSDDTGATWTATNLPSLPEGTLENAKISVSASNSRVWASLVTGGVTNSISYSDDHGTTWTAMDRIRIPSDGSDGLHPRDDDEDDVKILFPFRGRSDNKFSGAGGLFFALLASPTQSNEVYVAGDLQETYNGWPNYLGAVAYTSISFRGNSSVTGTGAEPSPQWEHMTNLNTIATIPEGGTASGSGPHADSRDFAMRVDGSLILGDDGGIHVRSSPSDNTGDWFSLCGTMQAFESHNVAYEPIFHSVTFGTQDCANFVGTLGSAGTFSSIGLGDGNDVLIDFTSSSNYIYYYYSAQFLDSFVRLERSKTTGTFDNQVGIGGKFPLF